MIRHLMTHDLHGVPVRDIARRAVLMVVLLALLGALTWPSAACACAVCYGDSEGSGFIRGARWATVLMVGVTYALVGSGVALFVIHRRRGRRAMAEDEQGEARARSRE